MRTLIVLVLMCWAGQALAVCTNPDGIAGEIIYNQAHGVPQFCDGDQWWGIGWKGGGGGGGGSTPAGAIMAFDLEACPLGWSIYTAAQGRFLRGIDPSGTVDPDGVRVIGDLQDDAMQRITGKVETTESRAQNFTLEPPGTSALSGDPDGLVGNRLTAGSGTNPTSVNWRFLKFDSGNSPGARVSDDETRPKNVAVLYCRKD